MRAWLFLGSLGCVIQIQAQISVYDCGAISQIVTQSEIEAANNEYYKQCIMFIPPETYEFNGNLNRKVTAATNIHLKEGVHIGPFTQDGQFWMQIQPKSDFDVAVMNYENLNNVLRYKKFEIGIKLPQEIQDAVDNYLLDLTGDKINPFLENELDIEIKFKHQSSGQTKSIDCFYYREYQRNSSLTDWDELPTEYDIRGRYAPPINGKWEAYVVIKVAGVPYMESQVFLFNVIESGDPGYVKVHENNRNLKRGDRMIFPVGHNLPSPYVGVKRYHNLPYGEPEMSPNMTHKAAKPNNWVDYLNDVASYGDQGGRFIRTLQTPWSSLIEFEKLGNYYDRLHYAWEQDKLLEICEERDILIQYNLMIHEPIMKVGDYSYTLWDWDRYDNLANYMPQDPYPVYCYNTDPQNKEPYQMFLIEEDLKFHEQRTRYYISRYGYSTNIYEFEILSEPWHLNEMDKDNVHEPPPVFMIDHSLKEEIINAIYNYHGRISFFIKQNLGHKEHLVGIDLSMQEWAIGGYIDSSWQHPNIDLIGMNLYSESPQKYIMEKSSSSENFELNSDEKSYFAIVSSFNHWNNKPVIFSELGHEIYNSCSNNVGHFIDVMSAGFCGNAGFNMWDGFDYSTPENDQRELLWSSTIRAQQHFNADDIILTLSSNSGDWIQGRQKKQIWMDPIHETESVEVQYYVSEDKSRFAGYVRNRSFNIHTNRINNDCVYNFNSENIPIDNFFNVEWNQGPSGYLLHVDELKKNKNYEIDWYDYKIGDYVFSQCQNTQNKKMKLKFPILEVEEGKVSPIYWFVGRQSECKKSDDYNTYITDEITYTDFSNSLRIFPNPMENFLNIEIPHDDYLQIYNVDGRLIDKCYLTKGSNHLNLENFEKGTYLFQFDILCVVEKIIIL
jgi:hypothetical protein